MFNLESYTKKLMEKLTGISADLLDFGASVKDLAALVVPEVPGCCISSTHFGASLEVCSTGSSEEVLAGVVSMGTSSDSLSGSPGCGLLGEGSSILGESVCPDGEDGTEPDSPVVGTL